VEIHPFLLPWEKHHPGVCFSRGSVLSRQPGGIARRHRGASQPGRGQQDETRRLGACQGRELSPRVCLRSHHGAAGADVLFPPRRQRWFTNGKEESPSPFRARATGTLLQPRRCGDVGQTARCCRPSPSCPARRETRGHRTRTGRLRESRSDSSAACYWKNQAEFKAEMPRVV